MTCPSCGGVALRPVVRASGDAWSLWRCDDCVAYPVFPCQQPRADLYQKTYFERGDAPLAANYSGYLSYDGHRDTLRSDFIRMLRPHIRADSRVFDIGCATGTALEAARALGVPETSLHGVDISLYAIDVARNAISRARFVCADAERESFDGTHDLILFFDVLEHLKHPSELLRRAACALAPGGRMLITTPDPESSLRKVFGASWSEFRDGEHLCFMSRDWFAWIASSTGLRLRTIEYAGKRVTLEHAMSRLRAYAPFLPVLKSQRMLRINTFDRQFVVLERPLL